MQKRIDRGEVNVIDLKLFTKETLLFKNIRQEMGTVEKLVARERLVEAKSFSKFLLK